MSFHTYDVALELARSLREPIQRLQQKDRELCTQLRRAMQSVLLCVAEGGRRMAKDRIHLFRVAAGSAAEVKAALELAEAWGYLEPQLMAQPLRLLDRELALLWRLTERHSGRATGRAG